jgi:hypothetical protein
MTALTVGTASPWRPRTSWGRHGPVVTGWSRDLPGGAVLAVTEVPGRQRWRWMLRRPAALLPSVVAAEGTAVTADLACEAADQHITNNTNGGNS